MPIRRVRRKFEDWRQEPEHVRLRIASLLTAGSGVVIALLWLIVLLPLQLRLTQPSQPDETTAALQDIVQQGAVSGVRDVPTPSPSPAYDADKQLYHGTRPSLQTGATQPPLQQSPRSSLFATPPPTASPVPTASPSPTPEGLPVEVTP